MPFPFRIRQAVAALALGGLAAVAMVAGQSATPVAAAPPQAPTNLQSTSQSAITIDLSWTNHETGGSAVQLVWSPASPVSYQSVTLAGNATSYQKTGLSPATAYYFHVRSCYGSTCSAWSGGKRVTTLPAGGSLTPPTGLTIGELTTTSSLRHGPAGSVCAARLVGLHLH
jgi:hypothetical protein